jgi:hypothetical protein
MQVAFEFLHTTKERHGLYRAIFFEQHVKFQYPLSSLLVFSLMHALGIDPANNQFQSLNVLSCIFLAIQALACSGIALEVSRKFKLSLTADSGVMAPPVPK